MKATYIMMALALCCSPMLRAETLGDAIEQTPETTEKQVICSVQNGKMKCCITQIDLTRELSLPDAAFGEESYTASAGKIIVVIQGNVLNQGASPSHFQIPDFVSVSGKRFENEDDVHFTTAKNDMMSLQLNPNEQHRFVCFYILPVKDVLNGSLVFEKEIFSFSDDNTSTLPLPITAKAKISQRLVLPGVTDM